MPFDPTSPRAFGAMTNSDARSPRHVLRHNAAIFDRQTARCEIESVFDERDAERLREITGPAAQIAFDVGTTVAPATGHQIDAIDRLERANQYRCRRTFT